MDEEEDTHYCLKCGTTVVGIENYIAHRKTPCDGKAPDDVKPKTDDADKSTADDFFSSLELQSSSKLSAAVAGFPPLAKTLGGIVTRSKAACPRAPKPPLPKVKRPAKDKPRAPKRLKESFGKLDEEHKEDDDWLLFTHLGLKKSTSEEVEKLTEPKKTLSVEPSAKRYTPELFSMSPILMSDALTEVKDDEVTKFLEENNYDDSYYPLEGMGAMEDFSYGTPRGHSGGKWRPVRTSPPLLSQQAWEYLLNDTKDGEETESPMDRDPGAGGKWKPVAQHPATRARPAEPPANHLGGKWKPMETSAATGSKWKTVELCATQTGGKWKPMEPPSSTTGGKWKPMEPPSSTTGGKWKPMESPFSNTGGKWKPMEPPSSTTGGKWKPMESPFSNTGGKWKPMEPPSSTTGGKWKPMESPFSNTGGKWKPMESPFSNTGGKWKPMESPFSNTGGKWKPMEPLSTTTGGKWKPMEPPSSTTGGKWKPMEPPSSTTGGKWKPMPSPTYTSGKWKPEDLCHDLLTTDSKELDGKVPPVDHTRGKWMPSSSKSVSTAERQLKVIASCHSSSGKCLKTAGGLIQYFCAPCNRRLASKVMYKKHVMSELHFKRVLQENDLEFDSRSLKLFRGLFSGGGYKERGLGKRSIKKPDRYNNTEQGGESRARASEDAAPAASERKASKKRLMRKEAMRCEVCRTKLWSHQLGKHLVSYCHSRRAQLQDPVHQQLVLDNIHAVVRQAPFQCGVCKFYCNSHDGFKQHWRSDSHKASERPGGVLWCSFCKFECLSSYSMELHLDSNFHREVILAINKSMPIIIRQRVAISCSVCSKSFRYNRNLRRHCKLEHNITDSHNGPSIFLCSNNCSYKTRSLKSLQRHILLRHKKRGSIPYFCSACDVFFRSAEESRKHRMTQSHKSRTKAKRLREGKPVSEGAPRQCYYCPLLLPPGDLRAHINQCHAELRPKCSKCGKSFARSQELSAHVRDDLCRDDAKFRCKQCPYVSSWESEYLYHSVMHLEGDSEEDKVPCPLCNKTYTKRSLKTHIRGHTGDRPFGCHVCGATYNRADLLETHVRQRHEGSASVPTFYKCGRCSFTASTKRAFDLHQHDSRKSGTQVTCGGESSAPPCVAEQGRSLEKKLFPCPQCTYLAKTQTLLKRHSMIHADVRSHPCPHCPFSGRLAAHLKRHMRLHTGAKPYKCPHCPYRCNILENLRKHVLQTKLHPGKRLYECRSCDFAGNDSKEFRQHLVREHLDACNAQYAAVIAGIYEAQSDVVPADPLPIKPKRVRKKSFPLRSRAAEPAVAPRVLQKIAARSGVEESPLPTGSTLEDKRKVLEMTLRKIRSQNVEKSAVPLRLYPSPADKKSLEEEKRRDKPQEDVQESVFYIGIDLPEVDMGPMVEVPPAFILCDGIVVEEANVVLDEESIIIKKEPQTGGAVQEPLYLDLQ